MASSSSAKAEFDPNSKRELVRHNQHYIEFRLRDPITIADTMIRKEVITLNLAEMG